MAFLPPTAAATATKCAMAFLPPTATATATNCQSSSQQAKLKFNQTQNNKLLQLSLIHLEQTKKPTPTKPTNAATQTSAERLPLWTWASCP